ncbi:hypothetical protein A0H81_10915 [Grifola frondosa]|uniref:Protein ASI3 n=1 Tax=Grifola frondosa TaxID=5627 RepID=A0A1C7LWU0_GRIFR|nr:hypothetical protein A0H81_10915 [Grifola frondosa]
MQADTDALLNNSSDRSLLMNVSLSLASRFLSLPSRALARLRRLDEVLSDDPVLQRPPYATTSAEGARRSRMLETGTGAVTLPGPWGFATSGYFIGLFAMAFVLNRIQNIVVPPRRPLAYRLQAARMHRNRYSFRHILFASLFPIDLSSTFSRSLFRIPSIYLLGKALVIWLVILLQASHLFPSWQWASLQALGEWAAQKQMEDICWFTFTSACLALCIGTLTTGMEGLNNNNSPFNLFAFAFTLYIYSSPTTHADKTQGVPSRPDKHVIITMMLPLLQVRSHMIHCLEVKQRWARQRLIPTTICAVLNLIHFHSVVWVNSPAYPLTNYIPCVVESGLVVVVILTIALNALTQLLLEGAVTHPLFGHVESLMPKWDEDFGVALFRLGTASMEATSVIGLGNEVGGVSSTSENGAMQPRDRERGAVEIDRSGVLSISLPSTDVKAKTARAEFWVDSVANIAWHMALARFLISMWRACVRAWRSLSACGALSRLEADPYEQFLRGEPVSDDEDDFDPGQDATSGLLHDSSPSTSDEESDEDRDDDETVQLYADLSHRASTSASAPLLLAHMTDTSSSPLTRRRYQRLRRQEKSTLANQDDPSAESRRNCVICTVEPRDIICWPCRCLAICDDCRENLASRAPAFEALVSMLSPKRRRLL